MQALTDNALMLKVKQGDLNKLGLLYERHKKRLFGFFYNMNTNAALSEDLVQNVFERVLKYKHTFTGEGSFSAWMYRMARNVNYDHFKKNKNEKNNSSLDDIEYNLADGEDLNELMDQKDNFSQLTMAMQRLPKDKRELLVLSKQKQLKFTEIGELLGCSESTAKVRAHRALKELRVIFLQMQER
jgi:RNA polymerase sigma-70 factor (ECF subfamily)